MTLYEALECADEWTKGYTFHEGQGGWRVVVSILADEVRDLQSILELVTGVIPLDKDQIDQTQVIDSFINDE